MVYIMSVLEIEENGAFLDVDLPLAHRREGKIRISYDLPDARRLFITTDRLSAFDRIIGAVPLKGQVLNQLSWWWFNNTSDIVAHHALELPDPNVLIAQEAAPLSVEVVVRGHITGVTSTSLWRCYEQGAREIYGYVFPDGLQKNDRLPKAIVTPTTKAAAGLHDEPLSCSEVVSKGLVEKALWDQVHDTALRLFARGEDIARRAGLILADTKYEFGLDKLGNLLLIDEVHTPDSSRYWDAMSYEKRLTRREEPLSMDKEIMRRALVDAGYKGEGAVPVLPKSVWIETSQRYIDTFEKLTQSAFVAGIQPTQSRIFKTMSYLWETNNA
jgi:phosphoribosylaminoimidazole-succinocarboxamide synthase